MQTAEIRWAQVRVGLLVAIAGILAFSGVVYVGLAGSPFARRAHLNARFADVSGLAVGSPVEMGGVVVGEVEHIELPDIDSGLVPVTLALELRALPRLSASSVAFNSSHALVGQRFVGLTPRKPEEAPLQDGDEIPTRASPDFNMLFDETARTLRDIRTLATDMRHLTQALTRIADALAAGEGTLGQLLTERSLFEELLATTRVLRAIGESARHGDGAIALMLEDKRLADDVRDGAKAFSQAARRLESGQGILGRLTQEGESARSVDRVLANLDKISTELAATEGTLGSLIGDPALLEQMSTLISRMDGLVADVRKNPDRYLKIQAF